MYRQIKNEMIITKQFGSDKIRVVADGSGEPWFVGKDIADALGYFDTNQAIRKHCKHGVPFGGAVDSTTPFETLDPQTIIIPERDVYRLIMRSKLPYAEKFEEWVVS